MGKFLLYALILYVAWHFLSKKKSLSLAARESQEGNFWEVDNPFPTRARLELKYQDAQGKKTKRLVDVSRCSNQRDGLLVGHCHLRDETRTFRIDRIIQAVNTETGEIIDGVHTYLWERHLNSPEFAAMKLLEDEYDTLRILLYVGKADGQLRENEKVIIRTTCKSLAPQSTITDEAIDSIFRELAVPTVHAFKLAVTRQEGKPETSRRALIDAAERMVATQKTVHPAEQEALDYMHKKLTYTTTA